MTCDEGEKPNGDCAESRDQVSSQVTRFCISGRGEESRGGPECLHEHQKHDPMRTRREGLQRLWPPPDWSTPKPIRVLPCLSDQSYHRLGGRAILRTHNLEDFDIYYMYYICVCYYVGEYNVCNI